ncbi:hypothetical protein FS837_002819 [Tulasnella sp. UAMH 9824]|nr:hypothetical protein FS837_002819 [Tulasnella sp. UAMH 9824]
MSASKFSAINHATVRRLEALEVREILDIIMSFLDDNSLFVAGLVCKTWSPVALNHLWGTLDSVVPLLLLLGPMTLEFDGMKYADAILEADWARFESYSRRVRKINNEGVFSIWELGPGAFAQVGTSRPPSTPYILPRVTEINWTESREAGWLQQLIPLLSPSLKSFSLKMMSERSTSVTDARVVLRHLASLPRLKLERLQARWPDSVGALDAAFCDVLYRQRTSLKSISHQSFNLDKQFGTYLSQLPNLVNLELRFIDVNTQTDEEFKEFSHLLASKCSGLETIRFSIPFGPQEPTFYAFRPLTRIEGLREFHLKCGELGLQEQDLREMGESWRSLVSLGFPNSRIPLPWVAAIAEHFPPTLENIDVDIGVSEDLDPDNTVHSTFVSLKRISYIEMASPKALKAVGLFLHRLVAPGTVVECAKWMEEPLMEVTGGAVKWKGGR